MFGIEVALQHAEGCAAGEADYTVGEDGLFNLHGRFDLCRRGGGRCLDRREAPVDSLYQFRELPPDSRLLLT